MVDNSQSMQLHANSPAQLESSVWPENFALPLPMEL